MSRKEWQETIVKKISGKTQKLRSNVEKTGMRHVVTLCVRGAFIKVTEKSLTMSDSTDEVRWRMLQCASLLVQRIDVGSLHGISRLFS